MGFRDCDRISTCYVYGAATHGFYGCDRVSSCEVDGNSATTSGFHSCYNLSSCRVINCTGIEYDNCHYQSSSCN